MKKIILGVLTIAAASWAACNNSNQHTNEAHNRDTTATSGIPAQEADADSKAAAEITPQFTSVDAKVSASLKPVFDHYLHIKNGLADDHSEEAADGGKAMAAALAQVDKAAMTPEQQKLYTENEDDLKEHAEHIGKNKGNIEHQREHFAQMSEDMYALAKAFGGGQALYHDYCPMYDNNKGALWLSEIKDIKNPYLGTKMPTCGSVKEVIK